MGVELHSLAVETFSPMLRSLAGLLDKAAAQGKDQAALIEARLAPDMLPLARQVRAVCEQARQGIARLTGEDPPEDPAGDRPDQTFTDFNSRIERTIAYVESAPIELFDGAEGRQVAFTLMPGLSVEFTGEQYLRDWTLPNFYFHLVTAYAILRSQGVEIGKADYLSHVGYAMRPGAPAA